MLFFSKEINSQTLIGSFNYDEFVCENCFRSDVRASLSSNSLVISSQISQGDNIDQCQVYNFENSDWILDTNEICLNNLYNYSAESVSVSEDGFTIALLLKDLSALESENNLIQVFKKLNGEWISVLDIDNIYGYTFNNCYTLDLKMSSDGNRIILGSNGRGQFDNIEIKVFEFDSLANSFTQIQNIATQDRFIPCMDISFSGDGNTFVIGTQSFDFGGLVYTYSETEAQFGPTQNFVTDNSDSALGQFTDISDNGDFISIVNQVTSVKKTTVDIYQLRTEYGLIENNIEALTLEHRVYKNGVAISPSGKQILIGFNNLQPNEQSNDTLSYVDYYSIKDEGVELLKRFIFKGENGEIVNNAGSLVNFSNDGKKILLNEGLRHLLVYDVSDFLNSTSSVSTSHCEFNIYPNPVSSFLSIGDSGACSFENFEIYNIHGELKLSIIPGNSSEVDVSDFPPGAYIIKSRNNNNILTKIFTKI